MQQGDILLAQTADGGEISVEGGLVEMTADFRTMAYLCLFGGNEDDDGREGNPANWWGNLGGVPAAEQYRSETQHLLQALPATTGSLRRLEDAALRDLEVFLDEGIASSVTATASLPGLNQLTLTVTVEARGERTQFEFTENWKAST